MAKSVIVPRAWEHVIAAVEATLHHTLTDAIRRHAAIDAYEVPGAQAASDEAQLEHQRLHLKIKGLEQLQENAAAALKFTGRELEETEENLRQYVADAQELRQRLADWAARAIL